MIQAGDTLGPYTLVRPLGRGAFSEVWLAERRSSLLTTQVALKLPFEGVADLDIVRQEAGVWLKASGHTNIVPVLEAEVYHGQVVIASEYVAGGSLEDWLVQHGGKAPSSEAAVDMVRGILAGLEHLHQNQLIHRDLKPDNVLLQGSTPRLTDFGLTRVLKPGGHTSNLAGTPRYMAPEAFQGEYSPASDLWAAGILLHELLVGAPPYEQTDFYPLLLAITGEQPVVFADGIPDALRPVLAKALAKPVSDRFVSALEMAEALHRAAASRPVIAAISPLRTKNNLPVQMTSFIGRDKEMAEVKALLSKTRLLTLTGAGGTGKTRLLLQAASDLVPQYEDGVWLVEFAPLSDPGLVPQAVATVLEIREEPGKPLTQTLIQAFKSKKLLLLLDTCEHLLDAAAALTEALVTHCPHLSVLASSRQGLGAPGERTYLVPSLSLPAAISQTGTPGVREVIGSEAVRLFADRAVMLAPDFALSDTNAPAVARLCHRLDGIPLAIELAAARVRSLPVQQIEARLHDCFHLLTGGSRTVLPRQQTLRALIDWSYDLLTETEKRLLCRLSVFVGGWSLEAAEKVCSGGGIETWEMLDLMTSLVDKSLVVYEEERGEARYRLLETVRQYARDRLMESGETEIYQRGHRDYFLALAEEAKEKLRGSEQGDWLNRLETEHDNLRQAITLCLTDVEGGELGLRLGSALQQFWLTRGYLREGRERLIALLARPEAQGQTKARAYALNGAGRLSLTQGDCASARIFHEESLRIRRELEDKRGIGDSLNNLGNVAYHEGDYDSARSLYEQSLNIERELGNRQGIANSLNNLGTVARDQGDYASASSAFQESLGLRRELEDRQGVAITLNNLGTVARSLGDPASARSLHEESLEMFQELGNRYGIANSVNNLGHLARDEGNFRSARSLYHESLEIRRELGDKAGIVLSLEGFASLNAREGKREQAARLWGAAQRLREEISAALPPWKQDAYDREVAEVRAAMGEKEFAERWTEGRTITMEQAINSALEGVR